MKPVDIILTFDDDFNYLQIVHQDLQEKSNHPLIILGYQKYHPSLEEWKYSSVIGDESLIEKTTQFNVFYTQNHFDFEARQVQRLNPFLSGELNQYPAFNFNNILDVADIKKEKTKSLFKETADIIYQTLIVLAKKTNSDTLIQLLSPQSEFHPFLFLYMLNHLRCLDDQNKQAKLHTLATIGHLFKSINDRYYKNKPLMELIASDLIIREDNGFGVIGQHIMNQLKHHPSFFNQLNDAFSSIDRIDFRETTVYNGETNMTENVIDFCSLYPRPLKKVFEKFSACQKTLQSLTWVSTPNTPVVFPINIQLDS